MVYRETSYSEGPNEEKKETGGNGAHEEQPAGPEIGKGGEHDEQGANGNGHSNGNSASNENA